MQRSSDLGRRVDTYRLGVGKVAVEAGWDWFGWVGSSGRCIWH